MALRGTKRWGNYDKGFVISDHADWNELNTACLATKAENIYVTHGYSDSFSKYLTEKHGLNAQVLKTQFGEEE
jgi:putative mRNA 3-end processing factor